MTAKQFVIWFKGFSEACHHLNPTPQQWDHILKTLKEVDDETKSYYRGDSKVVYTYPYSTDIGGIPVTVPDSKQQLND